MRRQSLILSLGLCFTMLMACRPQEESPQLQAGDLLFQDLNWGPLCDAIEAVTEGYAGRDFSHCAMVVELDGELQVVEAIGKKVEITSIERFFQRSADTAEISRITVGRLKRPYQHLIPDASKFALDQVAEPYDTLFLMNNGGWYCSELIYESFKVANSSQAIFDLAPMTFKDPNTQDFFPAWVDYYNDLGAPIPEGKPGLNPGSISRSDKIDIIPLRQL